jgi:hypothetical protein
LPCSVVKYAGVLEMEIAVPPALRCP